MWARSPGTWLHGKVAVLLAAAAVLARAQTLGNPVVGFDEQFYLLVGDRMVHGAVPFVDIFDRKPIGLFLIHMWIRWLGGEGTVQSQLVACAVVAATAFTIYRLASRIGPMIGAVAAALAYVLWLDIVGGEGAQADVWFNLPMALAGLVTVQVVTDPRTPLAGSGALAMALVGLALQIKYSVVFEGVFFGLALIWTGWRRGVSPARLVGQATMWAAIALVPTAVSAGWYAAIGQLPAFLFANFQSIAGKLPDPADTSLKGLGVIVLLLSPLLVAAAARPRGGAHGFLLAWLGASAAGMLAFGTFARPHYALPLLVPLATAAAVKLGDRRWVAGVLALGLVGSQATLALSAYAKGDRHLARRVAEAARPRHGGCLYVYDGYPALYRLTQSCLPSRWVFPGHLDTANEASAAGLGVDPTAEVRRILATRPETIVDVRPVFTRGNAQTRALVEAAIAKDYRLVLNARTGSGRARLVYRRKDAV